MKILLLAVIFFAYESGARVIEDDCNEIAVHNINHEKEQLLHIRNSPYQLAIDYNTNVLFFSFSNEKGSTLLNSAYLNLKTGEYFVIKDVKGGFANAVDHKTNTVYLGGSNGIYKFNYDTKKSEHLDGTAHNIWQLFYKDNLYYTTYPDENLYLFKDGKYEKVPELSDTRVLLAAIDNNNNIYFSNSSGLYVHKRVKNYDSFLGDYNLNSFASDINGNLYFSTPTDIYYIDGQNIERLASMDNIYGMAIENDGSILIADYENIFRLKPSKKQC
ncbi:ommochrome-binding protein-like [Danaus plexippus]|uniref:ommochrome-binding protein-like n=1 Tax=Danaus plexippus TaxID=13037 RepID=UPI002AB0E1BB|nr:ommochrome-binding protein-like [Danaus plexippus]